MILMILVLKKGANKVFKVNFYVASMRFPDGIKVMIEIHPSVFPNFS